MPAPQGGLISGLRAALRRLASETRLRAQSCRCAAIHLLAISQQALTYAPEANVETYLFREIAASLRSSQ